MSEAPHSVRPRGRRVGLVLAGGGARGAYEVGVCSYLFEAIEKGLGAKPRLDVVTGTSIGALNACLLAASADDLAAGASALAESWTNLELRHVLRLQPRRVWAMLRALVGRPPRHTTRALAAGGLLDPQPLLSMLETAIPFARLPEVVRGGHLDAVCVATTRLRTMRPTIFVTARGDAPSALAGLPYDVVATDLAPEHALASAAIPFLFPAVWLDDALYCDGSIRHNVPLSPAINFGCDSIVIVDPRAAGPRPRVPSDEAPRYAGPLFLLGQLLNGLVLGRVDDDLDRLAQLDDVLAAGARRFGPGFLSALNDELQSAGAAPLRPVRVLDLAMPRDLGEISAAFVRSRAFRKRRGLVARLIRRLAEGDDPADADLVSYMLFDGAFAAELIALGREDAHAQRDRILAFFEEALTARRA